MWEQTSILMESAKVKNKRPHSSSEAHKKHKNPFHSTNKFQSILDQFLSLQTHFTTALTQQHSLRLDL